MDLQMFAKIPEKKFTHYTLNPEKPPDKAKAFEKALGYTKDNYKEFIENIENHVDENKFVEKGNSGYGMRYQQVMKLNDPNGKEANVLTAWVKEDDDFRMTSVYITEKRKQNEN